MRHANLSVFVPHLGCPNQCSFCDQRAISGASSAPTGGQVRELCQKAQTQLAGRGTDAEIAFFGGSFTAIDRAYMCELLEAAAPFVGRVFRGIRISTRPDCIDQEILELLTRYRVRTIELGAQSMSDTVLLANQRGHTAADVERAAELIKKAGLSLGVQMMTGLYRSDACTDFYTARRLAELEPDTVRIYPTVVMQNTRLAALYHSGAYRPQSLDEAVDAGAALLEFFQGRSIAVIRMGLHAEESIVSGRVAGPYHPAFRELCEGRILERQLRDLLWKRAPGSYTVLVSPSSVSKLCGHGGRAMSNFGRLGYAIKIEQDRSMTGLAVRLKEV